jgi:ABC-type sugar transport system ATPase subunit
MPLIELQSVSASVDGQNVLHDLCLQIRVGERVAVMGKSGAGKTSLLRLLAGLIAPTSGSALLHGQPVTLIDPPARQIALLSQDYALYPQLTVQHNILTALKQPGLGHEEIMSRCHYVVNLFQLDGLLDRIPSQISGGQAQRVALAKALARHPKLLLLDEPFSQLDQSLRNRLIDSLLTACEHLQIALVWVTHDPREAFQVASRIIVLHEGRLLQDASPTQLYQAPRNKLVAELCSYWPINWLPLQQEEFNSLTRLLPIDNHLVGVRAEHIGLSSLLESTRTQGQLNFDLRVAEIQYLGFANRIIARVGESILKIVEHSNKFHLGQRLRASVDLDRLLITPD